MSKLIDETTEYAIRRTIAEYSQKKVDMSTLEMTDDIIMMAARLYKEKHGVIPTKWLRIVMDRMGE